MNTIKSFLFANRYPILASLISLVLFWPSFTNFYSYDDFFHLKISNVSSFWEVLNFFNLIEAPSGWGFYRPITTQLFYFLGIKLFGADPFSLHVFSAGVYISLIFIIYKLIKLLAKNELVAGISTVIYSLSASHFAHFYFLGAFQEVLMTFFVIGSVLAFLKKKHLYSAIFMLLGLMSKETAVITPFLILVSHFYFNYRKKTDPKLPGLLKAMLPHGMLLISYIAMRVFFFGFATGDSYVWDISPRIFNTLFWYTLWSFNLPETLVDFVGSGLKINPNLFLYWGREFKVIFTLFTLLMVSMLINLPLLIKGKKLKFEALIFSGAFFILGLGPVIFLPIHKFPYYLTLPAIGFSLALSEILHRSKIQTVIFILIFGILNLFTLNHTANTHWVTRGAEVAERVYNYASENRNDLSGKSISFYDIKEDEAYPFSPTETIYLSVSGQDFFDFYFKKFERPAPVAVFGYNHNAEIKLESRQFTKYE